jgi:hypothetical protein
MIARTSPGSLTRPSSSNFHRLADPSLSAAKDKLSSAYCDLAAEARTEHPSGRPIALTSVTLVPLTELEFGGDGGTEWIL